MYCPICNKECSEECAFSDKRKDQRGCILRTAIQNYNYDAYKKRQQAFAEYQEVAPKLKGEGSW